MRTKDEEAKSLAEVHYRVESGLTHVYRVVKEPEFEASPAEPIKLLEINEATVPSGIYPLHFGPPPALGIHYPMVIMEVTPDEFHRIDKGLKLPQGWRIADLIPRPIDEAVP